MYTEKEFTQKIYNLLLDAYESPTVSIHEITSRHRISRTFATVLKKAGFIDSEKWIGGMPTMQQAELLMHKQRAYQKEVAKRAKAKKERTPNPVNQKINNQEEYALSILRNSDRYDYKVYRTLKQVKEEQVL